MSWTTWGIFRHAKKYSKLWNCYLLFAISLHRTMAGSVFRGGTHVWCHLSTLLADPRPVPYPSRLTACPTASMDTAGPGRRRLAALCRSVPQSSCVMSWPGRDGQGSVTSPTRRWRTCLLVACGPPKCYLTSREEHFLPLVNSIFLRSRCVFVLFYCVWLTVANSGRLQNEGKTRVLSPARSKGFGPHCPRVGRGQSATACTFKHLGYLTRQTAIVMWMETDSIIVHFSFLDT